MLDIRPQTAEFMSTFTLLLRMESGLNYFQTP